MFNREKPLPTAVLQPGVQRRAVATPAVTSGINLGSTYWDPERLPNAHIVAIGASGSGKTQTLKAIAHDLGRIYPTVRLILIDFHGDQALEGEIDYALNMASDYGINPLVVNLDPEGGGPDLQSIQVAALLKKSLQLGPNQEGLLLEMMGDCYAAQGIVQDDPGSWHREAPNFGDLKQVIEDRVEAGCKDSAKLKLKLSATFTYGVFNRSQVPLDGRVNRVDLSKLPAELAAIAAETLARQLMNAHKLAGEVPGRLPRTFLFIDEAKEMPKVAGSACDRIIADGRKYGLALVLASQSERHLSLDVIGNSATKIVLPVDQTEVKKVARKFRFAEQRVAKLEPLTALCRFGTAAQQVDIWPYYERVGYGGVGDGG